MKCIGRTSGEAQFLLCIISSKPVFRNNRPPTRHHRGPPWPLITLPNDLPKNSPYKLEGAPRTTQLFQPRGSRWIRISLEESPCAPLIEPSSSTIEARTALPTAPLFLTLGLGLVGLRSVAGAGAALAGEAGWPMFCLGLKAWCFCSVLEFLLGLVPVWFCSVSVRVCSASVRFCSASVRFCSASVRFCSASVRFCSASVRFCSASVRFCSASVRCRWGIRALLLGNPRGCARIPGGLAGFLAFFAFITGLLVAREKNPRHASPGKAHKAKETAVGQNI